MLLITIRNLSKDVKSSVEPIKSGCFRFHILYIHKIMNTFTNLFMFDGSVVALSKKNG